MFEELQMFPADNISGKTEIIRTNIQRKAISRFLEEISK